MADVKQIQCPACGSNSTFKLFDGTYQCNYCSSNFLLNDKAKQVNNQATGELNNSLKKIGRSYYYIIIGAVFMFFVYGIIAVRSSSDVVNLITDNPTVVAQSKQPIIQLTHSFAGTKGAVVWIITQDFSIRDSVFYNLQIVDPLKKSKLKELRIISADKINTEFDFSKQISSQFFLSNDLAYNISANHGLVAYNIYNGAVEVNNQKLVEQYKELQDGILKVEHKPFTKNFIITTNRGENFVFNSYLKKLETIAEADVKSEIVTTELYLSAGLKQRLYLFTKKGSGFPILSNNLLEEHFLNQRTKVKGANVKDIFGNINIEEVSDRDFFRADPMFKDSNGNLILMYKTNLSESASVVLESINTKGEINWSIKDSLFLKISSPSSSENMDVNFGYSKNELVIYISSSEEQYIGIDISTGKKLWVFSPKQYIIDNLRSKSQN